MDKNEELQKWLNDDRYVQRKELEIMWNMGREGTRSFLRGRKIKSVKTFSTRQGTYAFYDKQQCINARAAYNAKIQELQNWSNNTKFIQVQELALKWGITAAGVSSFLHIKNIRSIKRINIGCGGNYAFYDRAECERARPFINQPKKEVEKVENIGELATATKNQILCETGADNFVWDKVTMKHRIMPVKNYCDERGNFVSLFKKDETVSAILAYKNEQKQLLEKCLADKNLVTTKDLETIWNCKKSNVYSKIYKLEIKPHAKVKLENGYIWHFYKKSDCIESQKVEKVEQVNLPEAELDSEELATENGKALNDNELAAIIDACKDPIDKTMILSALCFGIRTGELDSLNLRDISGAEICLQSPSGVVKMRIPKQYEDARTELITYYVDNGNSLSGDMPVFLNRSGVRMTRQGLNNRMKSVSESANIGRDVKLADLRATFAQNIYKKTEKNIASVHKHLRLSGNTNIMGYLLETQTKDQKAMPVDLMNSLTASYQVKEPLSIAEPKEQTPDIIPADTIDLFTMSELESELKQRGVELTDEVKAKINASDMPEMQDIATMIRGNAKTIAVRLSVLNEIAGQLKPVKKLNFYEKMLAKFEPKQSPKPIELERKDDNTVNIAALSKKQTLDFIRNRLQFKERIYLRNVTGNHDITKEHRRFDMSGYDDSKCGDCTLHNLAIVNEFADLGIYDYTDYLFLDFYKGQPTLYMRYFKENKHLEFELYGWTTSEIIYFIFQKTILSGKNKRRRD